MLLFSHSHNPAAWVLLTCIHACFLCYLQSQKLKANIEKLPSTCFVFAYCYRYQLFSRLTNSKVAFFTGAAIPHTEELGIFDVLAL